jgi:glycosyltransferase involved in cell wall biosynthesis
MSFKSKARSKAACVVVQNPYEIDIRVRRKAEALVAAGYTVDAIALRSSHSPSKSYMVDGVRVHTISLGKMRGTLLRYLFEYIAFFFAASFKLVSLMRQRSYDFIDVNTLPDFLVFAAWYPKLRGAKVILDMHELTPEFFMSKYSVGRNHWLVRLTTFLERISFWYADYVITINEPVQQLFENRGLERGKSIVMMNAADDNLFSPSANLSRDPECAGKFVMMYHGTLTHIYGLDISIKALAIASQQIPEAELWILGDGPEKASLQSLARELGIESKVRFIGRVLPAEISAWLHRCDIGVLATRSDVFLEYSFSNKLTEYIIMGKAVIASRLKTINHYFSERALAFFEPNDPTSLAAQMIRLCKDADLRPRLAAQARIEYSPISWEVMKARYLNLVKQPDRCVVSEPSPQSPVPDPRCADTLNVN